MAYKKFAGNRSYHLTPFRKPHLPIEAQETKAPYRPPLVAEDSGGSVAAAEFVILNESSVQLTETL